MRGSTTGWRNPDDDLLSLATMELQDRIVVVTAAAAVPVGRRASGSPRTTHVASRFSIETVRRPIRWPTVLTDWPSRSSGAGCPRCSSAPLPRCTAGPFPFLTVTAGGQSPQVLRREGASADSIEGAYRFLPGMVLRDRG